MQITLARWLVNELEERGWSQRELARRAGISQTTVSQVIAEQRKPTWDFCAQVAQVLGVPEESVFRIAGLLPQPSEEHLETAREIAELLASLPDGPIREQAMVSILAITKDALERAQAREREKEETGR